MSRENSYNLIKNSATMCLGLERLVVIVFFAEIVVAQAGSGPCL